MLGPSELCRQEELEHSSREECSDDELLKDAKIVGLSDGILSVCHPAARILAMSFADCLRGGSRVEVEVFHADLGWITATVRKGRIGD